MHHRPMDMLILFVTGRCNAKCQHCFYWQNLGRDHEGLELNHLAQIASSMPPFRTLLLSGGEPTLREDLPQLIRIFVTFNRIRNVSIPTNGLLPQKLTFLAEEIVNISPKLLVSFNVSIDGFADIHDQIRGVPGAYDLAMESLSRLREVADKYANLRVWVNTVIMSVNHSQILDLANHILVSRLADGHFFEIIRGEPLSASLKAISPEALKVLYKRLLPIQATYLLQEAKRRRGPVGGILRYILDMGNLINRYYHQWKVYAGTGIWNFPCRAGQDIGVIDYNGYLRICELRNQGVDLKDFGFNFWEAWNSKVVQQEREIARSHLCDCTHTCFIGVSMRRNFSARFLQSALLFVRFQMRLLW